ncbi:MAG: type IX secretion system sortase PorU [Ignavibacteria bacterium]|nr:type IX secretion system sortase PorU [Ignavibacteria bacterium]NNJ53938.1 type IX secretion system sortase PorU [Ignavibacteriaceae bacterium]
MKSKILLMLLGFSCLLFPQKDIRIISSKQSSIVIEYTPFYLDTSVNKIENQVFRNIDLAFGQFDDKVEFGTPAVPDRRLILGVPSETGNTIRILASIYEEISGKVIPFPFYEIDGGLNVPIYKTSAEYFTYQDYPELVSFGDYGISRNLGLQTIRVFPVRFDVNTNTIRLYKKIVFQIDFASAQFSGESVEDDLLKYSILNYSSAKSWIKNEKRLKKVSAVNSVLATGSWVKFETPEEGIYKIDRTMMETYGFDPASIDPRTIKIYNNGGKVLSENPEASRPADLVENAIQVFGESDGTFDAGDYILFYGRGSTFREFDSNTSTIEKYRHPYSSKNFYWITYGGANGKRIQNKESFNGPADFEQNTTKAFVDYEVDKINLANTGREFFGDDFSLSVPARTYLNKLDGRISSQPINYKFRFVNADEIGAPFSLSENSTTIFNKFFNGYTTSYTVGKAYTETAAYNGVLPDNRSVLQFNFNAQSSSTIGYLDYYEILYIRDLKYFDSNILFFSSDSAAVVEYYLYGFPSTNIKVFDVTEFSDVKIISDHLLLSGGDCRFRVSEQKDSITKYIAVGNDDFLSPLNPVAVDNSNLRGVNEGVKFIIISHKEFLESAERLKTYRENNAPIPISTIVVDVEKIYNEFSGGIMDVSAIRDFLKYCFDNWQIKPEYFLFFGKGTYDYKDVEGFGDNFIPTWQTVESLQLIFGRDSYTSDDFFARFDAADFKPDIAFGRISARNKTEAQNYVDKIIFYERNSEKGNWRNLITLVADDGYTSTSYEGSLHTAPAENLSQNIIPPSFDIKKIYAADYPVILTGSGRRKPTCNNDILNTMNKGTLLVNYIGHGNPEVWAHEFIFERSVAIPQLENDKYFFLCAATCNFGYYDIPNFQSGAEELMFLPDAGAIATFNSARLVFAGQNNSLNFVLMSNLLELPREEINLPVALGYSVFRTKLTRNSINDQKFHLLGDPTLRLQIPQYFGNVDSLNGLVLDSLIQLKALSNARISGTILKPDSTEWNDYNGEGILTVYDSERNKLLEEINYPIVIPGGVIFRGRVSVNSGEFNAQFVVPKDIIYENKRGKIQFYFLNGFSDGLAFSNNIVVGGTDTTTINDGEGPEIEIFFDDASYNNAYLVGPEPELIVKLSDETGLNVTGTGVGHKLEGILNEDEGNPIDFTEFFTGDLDAGSKSGEVKYQFIKLSEGDYLLDVKAWDVFNNFSTEGANFTVLSTDNLVIRDVYNYPNPFKSNTTFTFQQNLNRPVDVRIKVYTIAGRMIKEIEQKNINQKFVKINWDGRDADGDWLANGTYLYKLIVITTDGEYSESLIGKMAVIK